MKLNVYSVFDAATKAFMRPFFMQSDGQAIRAFSDLCNDRKHDLGRHPEDYSLMRIGVWDDQNAEFVGEVPDNLLLGVQAKERALPAGSLAANEEVEEEDG